MPAWQVGQWPQDGMNDSTTWSPGAMSSTPGPTSVTMPAPSWPPRTGKPPIGMPPVTRWWSEWHMPAASIWILTSSFWGSPISISSIDHGWLNSQMSAPLVFTLNLLSSLNVGGVRPELQASNRLVKCRSGGDPGHQGSRTQSPDRHRSLSQWVVARQFLTGHTARDAVLHAVAEVAGFDQVSEHLRDVPEVEEVALPLDQRRPVLTGGKPEPAAADAVDLVLAAVGLVDDLFPEADDLALLVVDQDLLVLVHPVLQALHLQAQRDVADLVDPNAHHVFLGADVPAVGRLRSVEISQRSPVACFLAVLVGLQPSVDPCLEFFAGV